MPYMIGIDEAANPLLTYLPVILIIFSGYSVGAIISRARGKITGVIRDLILGNILLNLVFLLGFIIFGMITFAVKEYFTIFTYLTGGLAIFGAYLLLKNLVLKVTKKSSDNSKVNKTDHSMTGDIKSSIISNNWNIFILFGIALVASVLIYHAVIIYYHPIFSEYDSLYLFLPISESILLGNGLNHDFYLGSDVNMRYPPFTQAVNAWLIHSFEYSSVRLFPIYYLFLATVVVYSFVRNIIIKSIDTIESSFLSLIACSAFLVTPAVLVVSSRFSLQQDLGFMFILTASFYLLSEIVRSQKPSGSNLLMLSASLALMALSREVGTVISIAIFFLVPSIKFTENNLKLRAILTVLSFLPLYLYYFVFYGAVEVTSGLLLVLSNIAVFFIVSRLKNQNKFSSLIRPVYIICISPLVIPAIFIVSNVVMFNGVYPGIVFSDKYYEIADIGFGIFTTHSDKQQGISDLIKAIPRLDVLFASVAMGSTFIFFKFVGFARLIYYLKNNYEYSLVLILVIFLIVTWSFLLQSGFEISNIRHVLYFAPILSVIVIMGMKIGYKSSNYRRLYYYGVMVFVTYYFLVYNLISLNSNNFVGLFIDPNKSPIITIVDLGFAAVLISPLIIRTVQKIFSPVSVQRKNSLFPKVLIVTSFSVLFLIQVYVLGSSGVTLIPLKEKEHQFPSGWEHSVFDVIDYLNNAEQGNVLSIRAPAIPFFANRTNYDLFNVQAFAYGISDLLSSNTTNIFKNGMLEKGIKYIILPNEKSNLYYAVENLTKTYPILRTLSIDEDFDKLSFNNFNLYKYTPSAEGTIDLIDENHTWKSFGQTTVVQSTGNLIIAVGSSKEEKTFNRAYLQTDLKLAERPVLLRLDYTIDTKIGNATYSVEIRDGKTEKILFNNLLNNTAGASSSQTFLLPSDIVNKPLEFRIYIATEGPGQHALSLRKASITYT
ncbi:hypothetical protein BH18THE1_BH18THE1_20380 [soil metagenome]